MMNDQALENIKAIEKANKIDERNIARAGYGATALGQHVTRSYIGRLKEAIESDLAVQEELGQPREEISFVLGGLNTEILALCGLTKVIHGVGVGQTRTELYADVGKAVRAEAWAWGLLQHNPKVFEKIDREVRKKHSSIAYRRTAARALAKRKGYVGDHWTQDRIVQAGSWLVNCVMAALPDVFEWVNHTNGDRTWYEPALCADAYQQASEAIDEAVLRDPVYLPIKETIPFVWTSWRQRHVDPRINGQVTFLRTIHGDLQAACKDAIFKGSMKPALDAVTALQSVPWRLNKRVYGVIRGCMEQGIEVPGLPTANQLPPPPKDKPWDDMEDIERKQWRITAHGREKQNRAMRGERLLLLEDTKVAEYLHDAECFYTTMNCDWRGRVYPIPHFNFQREDRVRALFEFADGEPIGEDGIRWLQMHVANCGDFDNTSAAGKISKAPIEERIQWTINNMARIQEMVEVPLKYLWWTQADKPFLFLAACLELSNAVSAGPAYVTHLPVSFDGSCSGLQHLAAMTRDEQTASLVNLTRGDRPNDVYASVAEGVKQKLSASEDDIAPKFLALNIGRKECKRNVMTYSYSSKKFGMAAQQQVDYFDEMYKQVIRGEREEHPFGQNYIAGSRRPRYPAKYLSSIVFDTIEERVKRPAEAMKFLQTLAKALAHECKPVSWTSPAGIPWINRYHAFTKKRLRLWMWDKGVKSQSQVHVAMGHLKDIDKNKAANGVAPNFVHALDASHLMLTVNAAVARGITSIATVHDSFGCLASRATEFNKIIRQEFARMYETHDVLSEVLEQSKCDLTQHNWSRLPSVPQSGSFKLDEVEHAQYAFS